MAAPMKYLQYLILLGTVGLALAREFLLELGMQADYTLIAALGLSLTTLLVLRGFLPVVSVVILCVLILFRAEALAAYGIDKDMMLSAALVILLYPWIRKLVAPS